jgi:hypothetical protein
MRENGKVITSREDQLKMKEIESKISQISTNEKINKTRNLVSPTKFQTTQYTIVKKSLTPFIFTSTNKDELTLSKSKLEKENQTKKLYLSNNANNSNGKLKIKNINSLKYINTTNFLKFKIKDKDSKLPLLKIPSKEPTIVKESKTATFLSPPKAIANKKVKIKSITSGNRENIYLNTVCNSEISVKANAVSSKMFESKIINQIFKKELNIMSPSVKRQNTPNNLTRISIKK